MRRKTLISVVLSTLLISGSARAQETEALAKQVQNPIASLISVPFQNNFNFGVGPNNDLQYILNIQPVLPFKLNDSWNVISRTVLPLVYQPVLAPGVGDTFGLGDIQEQLYFSPNKASSFIWGVGPVLQFPSATDMTLGFGKWAAGPGAVGQPLDGPADDAEAAR